jgi:hypothetical protein
MKNLLAITLVFILSLFVVEQSEARYLTKEVLLKGEVIGSAYSDEERYFYNIVRYKNEVYWCQTFNPSPPQYVKSTLCLAVEL